MKYAILVLAYRKPSVLHKLIGTLDHPDIGFFVHVDRKSPSDFAQLKYAATRSPVVMISTKEVYWGGFSMVEATLDLIRLALAVPTVRRLTLISDDSFVISSKDRFFEVMDSHVNLWTGTANDLRHRYDRIYFPDSPASCPINPDLNDRYFRMADMEALEGLIRILKSGKYPLAEVYKGSQWWSLSRLVVERMMERLEDPWLYESFRFSLIPDESLFPTLLTLLSVKQDGPALYDTWDKEPRPYIYSHPGELPEGVAGRFIFMRKVASDNCPVVSYACALFNGEMDPAGHLA